VSRIRLYIDEDAMDTDLVNALRLRGVDTLTVRDAGMIRQPDEAQLRFASQQGRALYSFNVADFCRIHASWIEAGASHSGLILARQQRHSIGDRLRRLMRLITAKSAEELRERIEFLNVWA